MRIAISGTHCSGKTTLIDEFLLTHPEYSHEPEAYAVLQEDYGEAFSAEPSAEEFYRQLEFNVSRLKHYAQGECVIFERCPADYIAYMLALCDLSRDNAALRVADSSLDLVGDAIQFLDVIVLLPAGDARVTVMPDLEDPALRRTVDSRLQGILTDDDFGLFGSGRPLILEATGTTAQRLRILEAALQEHATGN